jgi:hypothetical protein
MDAYRRIQTGKTGEVHLVVFKDKKILDDTTLDEIKKEIATLLGKAMDRRVDYVFFPLVQGFVRNPLRSGRCDLVMGTVAGDETMQNTGPGTSFLAHRSWNLVWMKCFRRLVVPEIWNTPTTLPLGRRQSFGSPLTPQ